MIERPRPCSRSVENQCIDRRCCRRVVATPTRINSRFHQGRPPRRQMRIANTMSWHSLRLAFAIGLSALLSVAAGGCSWLNERTGSQTASRPNAEARPAHRVAHAEPHQYRSAPRPRVEKQDVSDPREASPLPSRAIAPAPAPPAPKSNPELESPNRPPTTPVPAVVPARPPVPPNPQPTVPVAPPAEQPRILNPVAPPPTPATPAPAPAAPPPVDPLPTQPGPPPPRQEPLPAPPNRANVTPPRQAGGGLASARPPPQAVPETNGSDVGRIVLVPRGPSAGEIIPKVQVAARLDLARRLLQRGKVIEARLMLQSIASSSPAAALHELGRSYDPYYIGQLPAIDDGSEPRRAAALYQNAISHGSADAGNDLDRLRASYPGLR